MTRIEFSPLAKNTSTTSNNFQPTNMKLIKTKIPDVTIVEPEVFMDARGYFYESHNERRFNEALSSEVQFVQDNHILSHRGVIRGLHYQIKHPQGKLIRVIHGKVFDVAVDIRRSSPTFGKWVGEILSSENSRQLWVPAGFAHGFLALVDNTELLYKTTQYYDPEFERSIHWNDPELAIDWPLNGVEPLLSEKDAYAEPFAEAQIFD